MAAITAIEDLVGAIPGARVWFRGQAVGDWPLLPGVLRTRFERRAREFFAEAADPVRALELEVNRLFRTSAAGFLPPGHSDVDTYVLARHHGLPTRLLDWTRDPLAALFFAVQSEGHDEDDGSLLILDPRYPVTDEGDRDAEHVDVPFTSADPLLVEHVSALFEAGASAGGSRLTAPMPFVPERLHGRVSLQGSLLTFHPHGYEALPEERLVRLRIPGERKPALRTDLRKLGVTWDLLFPDLDHVVREIASERGLDTDRPLPAEMHR